MENIEVFAKGLVEYSGRGKEVSAILPFHDVMPFHRSWYEYLGEERALELENTRFADEGKFNFFATMASNNEMTKHNLELGESFHCSIFITGIGKVVNDEDGRECYYIIARSPEVEKWRRENGLSEKPLSFNLGYDKKDIHHLPKDNKSEIVNEEMRELLEKYVK